MSTPTTVRAPAAVDPSLDLAPAGALPTAAMDRLVKAAVLARTTSALPLRTVANFRDVGAAGV